jgi:hypothetical protein
VVLVICGVLFLGLGALVVAGYSAFKKKTAEKVALNEMKETRQQVNSELADLVESGEVSGSGDLVGKMKEQMEKTATNLDPEGAATVRAMAAFMGRMQGELAVYEKISKEIEAAELYAFNVTEREKLKEYREMIRAFQASNQRLTEILTNSEGIVREALVQAKVSQKTQDATLDQFVKTQAQVAPLQLKIRKADSALCETSFAMIDLLEKNWGKWYPEKGTGELMFEDDVTLAAFQALQQKIVAIAGEQGKAQEQLVIKMRAMNSR